LLKPGPVKLLEKRRDARRYRRVEHDLGTTRHDLVDGVGVIGVFQREVLLSNDFAAVGRDEFANLLVHDVRPDVVG
jgi:hypothetical protein